jgi:hypothetical protein
VTFQVAGHRCSSRTSGSNSSSTGRQHGALPCLQLEKHHQQQQQYMVALCSCSGITAFGTLTCRTQQQQQQQLVPTAEVYLEATPAAIDVASGAPANCSATFRPASVCAAAAAAAAAAAPLHAVCNPTAPKARLR